MSWVKKHWLALWQISFLITATTWLFAPFLDDIVSNRQTLISEFSSPGMPYSIIFEVTSVISGLLLFYLSYRLYKKYKKVTIPVVLVAILGLSAILDILAPINCELIRGVCQERYTLAFLVHATETVAEAIALYGLTCWDIYKNRRIPSILFLIVQTLYGLLFVTGIINTENFQTISQFTYQATAVVWIAWYPFMEFASQIKYRSSGLVNKFLAVWIGFHGVAAIVIGFGHVEYFSRLDNLYLGDNSLLIGQHGIVIGLIFLYLSRHIARGERRAWQIILILLGLEIIKYSAILPQPLFLGIYIFTFALTFALRGHFSRGIFAQSWRSKAMDALIVICGSAISVVVLGYVLSYTPAYTFINRTYTESHVIAMRTHRLATSHIHRSIYNDAGSILLVGLVWFVLWSMFRPAHFGGADASTEEYFAAENILGQMSNSSEDFFKIWPNDKQYFWSEDRQSFIAYKVVGPIAFALADPIGQSNEGKEKLLNNFLVHCRTHGWRVCFLLVQESSVWMFEKAGLKLQKIGASAVIDIEKFVNETANNKWWRWQRNKGAKEGYYYETVEPPLAYLLTQNLQHVSDQWLKRGGHQEEGFALGYFDIEYLHRCRLHVLKNKYGNVVAFVNELPVYNGLPQTTIDMIRYVEDAPNANNYLFLKMLQQLSSEKEFKYFDIGFVPLAQMKGRLASIARRLGADRFSAAGLEQFKNKFEPDWQENFIAYDGDLGDLALIAIHLEKAMAVEEDK